MTHADAIGYAQILLAILLFALSAPAYMIATVDGRVRHLLRRYGLFRGVELFAALTVTGVMVILTLSYVSPHIISAPAFGVGIVMIALTIFAMMTLSAATVNAHRALVRRIDQRVRARTRQRGGYDEHLENLITVGASSAPGREKHEVLTCLDALAHRSFHDARNADCDLLPIVHGLGRVVLDDERPGSYENLLDAVDILRDCWVRIEESQRTSGREAAALRETICSLGEAAIRRHTDALAIACLYAMDTADVPFRLGRAAVRDSRVRVAVAAMNRLEVRGINETVPPELLGLVAVFSASGGSLAAFGNTVMERLGVDQQLLRVAGVAAIARFRAVADFESADSVSAYLARVPDETDPG